MYCLNFQCKIRLVYSNPAFVLILFSLYALFHSSVVENKTTVNILDDIGSMFDDLADQLDAMLD